MKRVLPLILTAALLTGCVDHEEKLTDAVKAGSVENVTKCLDKYSDKYSSFTINYAIDDAVEIENMEVLKLLLSSSQADDESLNRALGESVVGNHISLIPYLIERGADVNMKYSDRSSRNSREEPILLIAMRKGYYEIVKLLLQAKVNPMKMGYQVAPEELFKVCGNDKTRWALGFGLYEKEWDQAEFDAVFGDASALKTHLESRDEKYRVKLLSFAVMVGNSDVVQKMVGSGVKLTQKDVILLYTAVQNNSVELAKYLSTLFDMNKKYKSNMKATNAQLMHAVAVDKGNRELELFFSAGALKWTPLMTATAHGDLSKVQEELKKSKKNINRVDDMSMTALTLAIKYNHSEIFTALLNAGAKTDIPAKRSPFIYACKMGRLTMVQQILQKDTKPFLGSKYKSVDQYAADFTMMKMGAMLIRTSPDKVEKYGELKQSLPGSENKYEEIQKILTSLSKS